MKDEIKEIFRRMNDLIEHRFDKEYHTKCDLFKDIQSLLDYITNLQEENKKLKHNLEQMYNDIKDTYNEICAEQIDYKLRIDKAIGYMQDNNLSNFDRELYYILTGDDNEKEN